MTSARGPVIVSCFGACIPSITTCRTFKRVAQNPWSSPVISNYQVVSSAVTMDTFDVPSIPEVGIHIRGFCITVAVGPSSVSIGEHTFETDNRNEGDQPKKKAISTTWKISPRYMLMQFAGTWEASKTCFTRNHTVLRAFGSRRRFGTVFPPRHRSCIF